LFDLFSGNISLTTSKEIKMFTYVFHTRYRKNDKLVLYPLINYKTIQKYLLPSDPAFLSLHFMIISFVQTKLNPKYQFQIFPKISFSYPHPSPPLSFPSFSLSLISLSSSFNISLFSFPCVRLSLFPHNTFCTFFPILPSNTCFLSPHSYI
jgi:hypothetical protein